MAKILLLQTDRQLAKNIQDFFGQAGHDLRYFADPQTAISAADANKPDIIILDLFLASHSGIEFLYELRSYPEWQKIPVIITGRLSIDDLNGFREAFAQLNISAYHHQTLPLSQLLAITDNLLQPA